MTNTDVLLPAECTLRRACAEDIWSIRKLVLGAKLDPTQLRWQQFWVVECESKVVACAQLRTFAQAQELGSLVVARAWRSRGLGTYLTKHLIAEAREQLYLECLGEKLQRFYARFGFTPVAWQELPSPLKFKFGISHLAKVLLRVPVFIMQYQQRR